MSVLLCKPIPKIYRYINEIFNVTDSETKKYKLTHKPKINSLSVYLNGLENNTENDYALLDDEIIFYDDVQLLAGDIVTVKYLY